MAKAQVTTQEDWDAAAQTETALAIPAQEQGMDVATRSYTSDSNFDQEDMQIPRLRLAQKTTSEVEHGEAEPGDLVLLGAPARKNVVLIPVAKGKARELRDADENRLILCQSPDGKRGFPKEPIEGVNGDCRTCPMAQWGKNQRTGKATPPSCTLIYSYIMFDSDQDRLVTWEAKKTAANQAKFINSMLANEGMGKVAFRISGERKTAGGQSYFAPVATPLMRGDVQPETFARAAELAVMMLGAPADGE